MGMGFVFRNDIYESAEVTPFDGDSAVSLQTKKVVYLSPTQPPAQTKPVLNSSSKIPNQLTLTPTSIWC